MRFPSPPGATDDGRHTMRDAHTNTRTRHTAHKTHKTHAAESGPSRAMLQAIDWIVVVGCLRQRRRASAAMR